MRVLILGGTDEARRLAAALVARGDDVTSSLAGRVRNPALPQGEVVVGGFGGAEGLAAHLAGHGVDLLVDATHPFAARISANAHAAAASTGTRLLVLRRPGWTEQDGDRWHRVPDLVAAAATTAELTDGRATVFLTTGRRDLAPFVPDTTRHYLIRAVDPPDVELPPRSTVILDRGPYTLAGESELLAEHEVRALVTKDSGGELTRAKLDAARHAGVPVVMVDRPAPPGGVDATSVEQLAALIG